jgi:hypothetical protein
LPLPLAPEVIVIHEVLLVAFHVHPPAADTSTGPPSPAVGPRDSFVGVMVNAHVVDADAA